MVWSVAPQRTLRIIEIKRKVIEHVLETIKDLWKSWKISWELKSVMKLIGR